MFARRATSSLPFANRTPLCFSDTTMILPSVGSAIIVVLCGLARCVARNRVNTSSVMLAAARPMKSPGRMIGTLMLMIG